MIVDDEALARSGVELILVQLLIAQVLIAQGLPDGDIGAQVKLSPATVKDCLSAILGKLRMVDRVQAALLAQRAGLLRTGDGSPAGTEAVSADDRRAGRS
ncbi:MAG TPA: LuxR C-terminal-related transcriptional regulator [Kineosporiaceae bacterium]